MLIIYVSPVQERKTHSVKFVRPIYYKDTVTDSVNACFFCSMYFSQDKNIRKIQHIYFMVNGNWIMNKMQSGQTMNETAFCP